MSNFTITRLVDDRAIITGTDVFGVSGRTTVFTGQWDEINGDSAYDQATEAFDSAVEEFFAPLTEAAEKFNKSLEQAEPDSIGYVVQREAVEGRAAQPAQIVKLSHDSIVLRLIEQGDSDRLVWVGDDQLEVLAEAGTPLPMAPAMAADADPS